MIIGLTADYYGDAYIDDLLSFLYTSLEKHFKRKKYSENEPEIFMVVICQPKDLKLRKRYFKKENTLYYDVILDYWKVKKSDNTTKKRSLLNQL